MNRVPEGVAVVGPEGLPFLDPLRRHHEDVRPAVRLDRLVLAVGLGKTQPRLVLLAPHGAKGIVDQGHGVAREWEQRKGVPHRRARRVTTLSKHGYGYGPHPRIQDAGDMRHGM